MPKKVNAAEDVDEDDEIVESCMLIWGREEGEKKKDGVEDRRWKQEMERQDGRMNAASQRYFSQENLVHPLHRRAQTHQMTS